MKKIKSILFFITLTAVIGLFPGSRSLFSQSNDKEIQYYSDQENLKIEKDSEGIVKNETSNNSLPFVNLSFEMSFNTKDIFLGFDYNLYRNIEYLILFDMFFLFRPYRKTVFIEKSDNYYYQLKEHRFVAGLNVDKYFILIGSFGIYLSAGAGYTFGDFAGTEMFNAESKFIPTGGGGFVLNFSNNLYLKAGYQYLNVPDVPPNRMYFELSYFM